MIHLYRCTFSRLIREEDLFPIILAHGVVAVKSDLHMQLRAREAFQSQLNKLGYNPKLFEIEAYILSMDGCVEVVSYNVVQQ